MVIDTEAINNDINKLFKKYNYLFYRMLKNISSLLIAYCFRWGRIYRRRRGEQAAADDNNSQAAGDPQECIQQ